MHSQQIEQENVPAAGFAQASMLAQFKEVRRQTELLAQPLSAEDCAIQSMADASPAKWHLAHTTWFFETFILATSFPGYLAYRPIYRELFNSYYVGVGPRHPRPERGLLSRPTLDEVKVYRRHVDKQIAQLFSTTEISDPVMALIEMGVHHEQQHQELILTDVKHLLSRNPLAPAYLPPSVLPERAAPALSWSAYPDGIRQIGYGGSGFCYDNERPRHRVFVHGFEIATRLVTNREYLDFIADGGYRKPEFWLAEGWDLKNAQDWSAPLYWCKDIEQWSLFTLHGTDRVGLDDPVCHVSYFEADAYARWAKARLPTEAEWETMATSLPVVGNFMENGNYRPLACDRSSGRAQQVYGDAWEWTRSSYEPYPGFRSASGAVSEYNGKFMANQYVLRGGSCFTPASHIRSSYRNFFPASARWQMSGIRLARDLA